MNGDMESSQIKSCLRLAFAQLGIIAFAIQINSRENI